MKKDFYKISKYTLFTAYGLIFAIGIFNMGVYSNDDFFDSPLTMKLIAVCFFFLGLHLLVFNQRWAKDNSDYYTKMLESKPRFIQGWLGINKSYVYNKFLYKLIGSFSLISGIAFFISSFTR